MVVVLVEEEEGEVVLVEEAVALEVVQVMEVDLELVKV